MFFRKGSCVLILGFDPIISLTRCVLDRVKIEMTGGTLTFVGRDAHGLWFVIGVFQGSLLVIAIVIDGSEKRNCEGSFWTLEFACLWKAQ